MEPRCTHQGTLLTLTKAGTIRCQCGALVRLVAGRILEGR